MKTKRILFAALYNLSLVGSDYILSEKHLLHKAHRCARECYLDMAIEEKLIKIDHLEVIDKYGNTPLHYASYFSHTYNIKYLADQGVDVNQKNFLGDSPLALSIKYDKQASMIALVREGAYAENIRHLTSNHQQEIIDTINCFKDK